MPQNVGQVITLFISDISSKTRKEKSYITLDADGIQGDKYYKKERERSVLLTSLESYHYMKSHDIEMQHGVLGENILIDYNPYQLKPGQKLHIGSTILEISQYCTICNHLAQIDARVPELLKNDRGIFAKVIQEGKIQEGDSITLL